MGEISVTAVTASIFLIVVAFIIGLFYRGLQTGMRRMRYSSKNIRSTSYGAMFIVVGWLGLTGALSLFDFFNGSIFIPFAFFCVISVVAIIYIYNSKKIMQIVYKLPKQWFINIHFLRVPVELILWFLYTDIPSKVPRQVTIEGYNFDMAIAISSVFIAYRCFKSKEWPKSYATIWNYIGIAMLLNIVAMCVLTSDSPVRIFEGDTTSKLLFSFPFIWLPTFTLPFFLLMHLLSLKQIRHKEEVEEFLIKKRKKREGKMFEN